VEGDALRSALRAYAHRASPRTLYRKERAVTRRIKKVGVDEKVPVKLFVADRSLIVDHTFVDPELLDRLEAATPVRSKITVHYTLSELEHLQGFIAAEANHARSRKLQRQLYDLYDRIKVVEESYADELSPEWIQKLAT
jgi:hypothetical protein